jgi:hypothetical protein
MSFHTNNLQIGGEPQEAPKPKPKIQSIELNQQELEFLLSAIRNGLFRGEYVEVCYNLTLKLQSYYQHLKTQ